MIKAIATASFVHGPQSLKRGEEADFTLSTFTALAAHGLVREKIEKQADPSPPRAQRAARTPSNKKAPDLQNQAAPDSATTAVESSSVGAAGLPPIDPEAKQDAARVASGDSSDADQS